MRFQNRLTALRSRLTVSNYLYLVKGDSMSHYHDPSDMGRLKELRNAAPRAFDAWLKLDQVVGLEDGEIPRRYRELIAVACSHLTRCVYCMEDHVQSALSAGASKSE